MRLILRPRRAVAATAILSTSIVSMLVAIIYHRGSVTLAEQNPYVIAFEYLAVVLLSPILYISAWETMRGGEKHETSP